MFNAQTDATAQQISIFWIVTHHTDGVIEKWRLLVEYVEASQ